MEAAAPSKVKSSANRSNTKRQSSLWYDSECNNQRKVYNKLRNKYDSSKSDVDKLNRNEAQKLYVRIGKSKSVAYEKEETATFSCSTNLQIQGNTGRCDSDVAPVKFAEHFSQLYSTNNTYITQNMLSEYDYDVQNEILDKNFTIYEVERAINHLKCGKASGPDDIRNEYLSTKTEPEISDKSAF